MPIIKSAAKALRQTKKRTLRNKKIKDRTNYLEKKIKKLITLGIKKEAETLYPLLQQAFDKAAKIGVIKKNKAARIKSRIIKKLNLLK